MNVYILSSARTPIGSLSGSLSTIPAVKLGATAMAAAIDRSKQNADRIDEVFMGNVLQGGNGQNPARQAAIFAKFSNGVPCSTVNKVCGSGLRAIMLGAQTILAGDNQLVVAGGMENMSLAPHFIPNSRTGLRFGMNEIQDIMQWDGLRDAYSGFAMGVLAEECAKKYGFTREAQDAFAIESFKRAQHAMKEGLFKAEIAPVTVSGKKGDVIVSEDEGPAKANFEKMPTLKPVFDKNGTITPANASTINDGAAALVLGGESYRAQAKFRIVSYASAAHDPVWFTTAPVNAMRSALDKAKLDVNGIDLFEINEAFALVTMAAMKEFNLPHSKVNVNGGAVALGHPIGASGARVVTTLMYALEQRNLKRGLATLCIGGGEAVAIVIEKI